LPGSDSTQAPTRSRSGRRGVRPPACRSPARGPYRRSRPVPTFTLCRTRVPVAARVSPRSETALNGRPWNSESPFVDAGPSASAPRTAQSIVRRCVVVPRAAAVDGNMESRWGAWSALRRVGVPTALPRIGRDTLAASGSPGRPSCVAAVSASDGRHGTSRSFGSGTSLASVRLKKQGVAMVHLFDGLRTLGAADPLQCPYLHALPGACLWPWQCPPCH
jgi:hypothetical protein